jgi:hypothetical protein
MRAVVVALLVGFGARALAAPPAEDLTPPTERPAPATENPTPATEDLSPPTENPAPPTEKPALPPERPAPPPFIVAPPPGSAPARRPIHVGWSMAAGLTVALVPLAVGGALIATGDSLSTRRAGVFVLQAGLTLAPIVSHLVAGEWTRAAIFGAAPLALTVGMAALWAAQPDIIDEGTEATRTLFGVFLSLTVLASGAGLVDSLMAAERHKTRPIAVAPLIGRGLVGIAVGGYL